MTDTTTGDPVNSASGGCGAPVTGAPVSPGPVAGAPLGGAPAPGAPLGGREPAGPDPATAASGGGDGYALPRHASGDHGLPRPDQGLARPGSGSGSDDYGLQPHGLTPPTTRSSGYGLPPDDDPAAPPDLATLLRRHVPTRPSWTCISDGRPWPCAAARVHLRSQYAGDLVGLSMYMSRQLMTAAVDLADGGAPPPDLFRRFVAWT